MPSRTGARDETPIVLSLTALVTVVSFAPPVGIAVATGLAALVLTAIALWRQMPASSSMGVLFVTVLVLGLAGLGPQQLVFTLAFVVYGLVIYRVPWLRGVAGWRAAGSFNARVMTSVVGFAVISGVVVLLWYTMTQPDLADLVTTIPEWPIWSLVPLGIVFAAVNAVLEEAVYRGVVQDSLERALGVGNAALILQAVAFAVLHVQGGFPRGVAGIGLTFVYGLVMGVLRRRSGGLMAPVVAHTVTDLMIVTIVLSEVVG